MNEELKQLKIQVEELTKRMNSLNSNTTISLDVGEAFKARVLGNSGASGVSATAHNKVVNESGSDTYSVMDKPTGFVLITIQDVDYIIPYF